MKKVYHSNHNLYPKNRFKIFKAVNKKIQIIILNKNTHNSKKMKRLKNSLRDKNNINHNSSKIMLLLQRPLFKMIKVHPS